ncbi:HAMP domain-containing histidine kinase [Tuanshanicoccus lijuaniae]|uniref:sensor histidine kinase n=1 Tax=Aerococcaceae bacterium zg-1292 TaxID=2774330 RepID=UPI0019364418|nr:HAMP domain-containing histidine kinase [Aerococcaceae bacterium zg-1292]MBS4455456.1 HAMP domain-containing histidine kinase [Aerococcaceae bacterium zg-A91]MBS4457075.1 HAMP domain-containing histidine kinase [Aerococcaceae bacterium zg-BR33]QQA37903.1 HAMP domain-containing histidine kinase [Aerococcaceae bacterium zg-1292]
MKRLKLFPKTFLYTMIIMMLITIMIHGFIYFLLPNFYFDKKQAEVKERSTQLVEVLKETNEREAIEAAKNYALLYNVNIFLNISGKTHQFHGFTPTQIQLDPERAKDILNRDSTFTQYNSLGDHAVTIDKKHFKNRDGKNCDLYLILSTGPIDETKQVTLNFLPFSITISVIISLLAAYLYSNKITKPIRNILQSTKDMEMLKKGVYCKVESEDEIGMIADNVNSLYDTIWTTIESLEQKIDDISQVEKEKVEFLRAASHELKTPLTSLRVLLENMRYNIGKYKDRDLYLEKAQDIVIESTDMVQSILDVSKLQMVNKGHEERLDIRLILLNVLESYKVLARAKNLTIHLDIEEPCYYVMDKEALKKVFSNLISNAIHYTEQNKQINISVRNEVLMIENECRPLSENELKYVFDAFYRPDFSRNKKDGGTGLGLYIVKNILTDVNLVYRFEPSELGMKFSIDFGSSSYTVKEI